MIQHSRHNVVNGAKCHIMLLYNRLSPVELKKRLEQEDFERTTISFYRYFKIQDPQSFRDKLYLDIFQMQGLGRIYVAKEGINAQMSLPRHKLESFLEYLNSVEGLKNMPIKYAIEDVSDSFLKLVIKVKPKIVADGLEDDGFDVSDVGKHLSAKEFHDLVGAPGTMLVDMRNHYESEVGHFKGAILPDADTFREEIGMVAEELKDQKEKKLLLYCTGGVRCEKASAYFKHLGFKDVNQLHGGIIEYAKQVNELGLESKYIGKNFVFDKRLGESITDHVVSSCHQCGKPCDTHTNCANDACHLLFIQCPSCGEEFQGCCSIECVDVMNLPEDEMKEHRRKEHLKYSKSTIFSKRIRPKLHMEQGDC